MTLRKSDVNEGIHVYKSSKTNQEEAAVGSVSRKERVKRRAIAVATDLPFPCFGRSGPMAVPNECELQRNEREIRSNENENKDVTKRCLYGAA